MNENIILLKVSKKNELNIKVSFIDGSVSTFQQFSKVEIVGGMIFRLVYDTGLSQVVHYIPISSVKDIKIND